MYGKIIQDIECRGCYMRHTYPACIACEFKAMFEVFDRKITSIFNRSLFSISPFWKEEEHESRWREEHSSETAPKGTAIRVPLVFG
jgi:hypothetical protein